MTALRTLAQSCNFCSCLHDSLVRDRLLLGIRNSGTRKKLLEEKKLTLSRAIDICKSSEATSQQMKTMAEKPEDVLAFDSTSKRKTLFLSFFGIRVIIPLFWEIESSPISKALLIKTSWMPVNPFIQIFTALVFKVVIATKLKTSSFLKRIKICNSGGQRKMWRPLN